MFHLSMEGDTCVMDIEMNTQEEQRNNNQLLKRVKLKNLHKKKKFEIKIVKFNNISLLFNITVGGFLRPYKVC